jgi:uncharacterized protein YndB with AHSA1/START domain
VTLQVCPTEVVNASAERVWHLITMPRELAAWTETSLVAAPARELRAGDRLVVGAGPARWFRVIFRIREAVRPERFAIDVQLPLGVTNDETIRIAPIGPGSCRVAFE